MGEGAFLVGGGAYLVGFLFDFLVLVAGIMERV